MSLKRRVERLKLLLLDVDGVLTSGDLFYLERGEGIKVFSVHDGLGIKILQSVGVEVGVVSGRSSQALENRLEELGINKVHMGRLHKRQALEEICREEGLDYQEVGFIGDDYVDIPILRLVGFPVAVSNAYREVKKHACYITSSEGGEGAVREVAELIIALRGLKGKLLDGYR